MKFDFQPGDVIDFTVRGVRVVGVNATTGEVSTIADEHNNEYPVPPQAAVTRMSPKGWPIAYGDLWHDRYGTYWFAVRRGPGVIGMVREDGPTKTPRELLDEFSPLTLVNRKPAPDEAPF